MVFEDVGFENDSCHILKLNIPEHPRSLRSRGNLSALRSKVVFAVPRARVRARRACSARARVRTLRRAPRIVWSGGRVRGGSSKGAEEGCL